MTLFLKALSLEAHRFYGGKMQTVPKCGIYGLNWFNVWYTPGVSKVSTTIRDGKNDPAKLIEFVKMAQHSFGAVNLADGGDPAKMVLFDSKGSLHSGREDIRKDPRHYRKWELCEKTNPGRAANEAKEGVARLALSWQQVYDKAKADIAASRRLTDELMASGHIATPPRELLDNALASAIASVK